ncbi:carboxylesterase family domain protein [Mycobacterium xenopi 4042]|uniref:Carboxylesterase family domain protein n=1 Tax=Mycobacterium xenopi 4042 TaxID=1299334 RepID=X8AQN7_MYCXE|nr:carboxylesterase family domain protein [Mycobacterium xenopi 4042]
MDVTTRCSRAGARVLQQGRHLAADAVGTYRTGALLLRGSPVALGWFAGWLSAEFSPQVLTGHALSRITPPPVGRVATAWAAQRADQILTAALEESFGPHYRDRVCHPLGDQRGSVRRDGLWHSVGHRRRYAAQTSDIAYGPGVATTCWISGASPTWRAETVARYWCRCPAAGGPSTANVGRHTR